MRYTLRIRGTICAAARLLLVSALCAPLNISGQQATLLGDAHVSSSQPTVNSGALSNLNVGNGYTALIQFDLGALPTGTVPAQIAKATLRVYCNRADAPGTVQVQAVAASWTEFTVTFATLPALGPVVQTAQAVGAGEFVAFDVTSAVQGWVTAPGTNFGLALAAASSAVVQFDSKENDQTSHAPQLEIALVATGAAGPAGPQGVQGSAGAPGSTGLTGATGATGASGQNGLNGATGATGAPGPAGASGSGTSSSLVYQGVYSSTTNYTTGAVVEYAGSSWVSLIASNAGQTPGLLAGTWGLVASEGAPGAVGAVGSIGATGQQGPIGYGVQGSTGPTGASGTAGPAGTPGLAYQGAYSSQGNYLLGDVVLFQGASYVSLTGFNVGQTPGLSPTYWGTLTSSGPTGDMGAQGLVGAQGPEGLPGPVGSPGSTGAQGAQGIPGEAGGQGIPGTTGSTGLSGPMGPQGPAGPVGMSFTGAYDPTSNYTQGDGVLWQGAGWVSLIAGNHGNTPSLSPLDWAIFAASGAPGATGQQGPSGAAGLNGLNGPSGSAGPTGPTGASGSPGTAGLVYQGAYNSVSNYLLGDVVLFDGASWVSLLANNVGQTPVIASAWWGVLTSPGAQGVVGPAGALGPIGPEGSQGMPGSSGPAGIAGPIGIQGPTGSQGLTGSIGAVGSPGQQGLQGLAGTAGSEGVPGTTGANGSQGPSGPVGALGPVGMSFIGAYDSTLNYALGNGVLWQGAGWVSLIAENHGNTPSTSPADWGMFSAPGAAGATGVPGAQGIAGPSGALGLPGATGAAGSTGAQGSQGVVGPAGAQGASGPAGTQGPAGAQGLTGPAGATGSAGPQGLPGVAGTAGAQGLTGSIGNTGLQGATGATGIPGSTGPTGANGVNGIAGTPGLTWRGAWNAAANYALNDAASYSGATYLSIVSPNVASRPDLYPAAWSLLAQAGAAGTPGATGGMGATGAAGPQGSTGATGMTGAIGAAGAIGMNFRNAWNAASEYAVNDAVTFAGSTYLAQAAGSNAEPNLFPSDWSVLAQVGNTGAPGGQGLASTVSLGSVTTLVPGSLATVTNSGTPQAAVFNFGLPQGAAGAAGGSGSGSGTSSGTFAAMYHGVSFYANFYSVNSPNANASEMDGSVLAWVPQSCTATELTVYSQQAATITITLRTGTPGAMANTALTCSPITNGSCTVTGAVTIAAGNFIDYQLTAASGTTAAVWTSLQCQ